jgi:hypothetical protein
MKRPLLFLFLFVILNSVMVSSAQEGIKTNYAAGEVASINESEKKIILQTKDGIIEVVLTAETEFKKVPPENPKLSAAVVVSASELSVGDKLLVIGTVSSDKKSIPAKVVYLITKSDIAKKQEKEREEWRTRGISGRVISLDVPNQRIIISARSMMGERTITIIPKQNAEYRRYAPDSVKFSDAKLSNYAEMSVGDLVRALGDRSPDGNTFTAEKIVFGSFKTLGGKITAIDPQKREIIIKDIISNKEITIVVSKDSLIKRFPAEFASMFLARMQGNMTFQPLQQKPSETQTGRESVNRPQFRSNSGGDFDDLFERFPNVSFEDLKIGDAIAVSSTVGTIPNRFTAIKILSGIESFLEARQAFQNRRGFDQPAGLNIPGLDAISFP